MAISYRSFGFEEIQIGGMQLLERQKNPYLAYKQLAIIAA